MVNVQGAAVPSVLAQTESVSISIALGFWGGAVMDDPFLFDIYYQDVEGEEYRTTVRIHPKTGEICGLVAPLPWPKAWSRTPPHA